MDKALSITTTTLLLLLIANVFIDVVLRYAFNNSSIALQELEWHLFSAMFLLSIAYGLQNDTHVRVDVFYLNFSLKTQAFIDIIGSLVFIRQHP
jgi:TRAP-type mannitol/chloroaromatic compound transport system permease small subunit